ncbi:MAG: GNAT family N-acetyltransferase [Nitrospira sp.]
MIEVRPAVPDDAPLVATLVGELLHEIMAALQEQAFGVNREETESRARTWIADGRYVVFLASSGTDRAPAGFLALYESYALYTEGPYGTIPEFYVRPSSRSQGVGAALLAEARRYGGTRNWRRLEVTTPPLPQFDRTFAFYRREGFSISGGRKMKLELP